MIAFQGIKTSFAIDLSGVVTVAKSEVVVDRKPTEEGNLFRIYILNSIFSFKIFLFSIYR